MHKRLIEQDNLETLGMSPEAAGAWLIAPDADPGPHVQWLSLLVARDEGFRRFLVGVLVEQAAARRHAPRT